MWCREGSGLPPVPADLLRCTALQIVLIYHQERISWETPNATESLCDNEAQHTSDWEMIQCVFVAVQGHRRR